MGIFESTIATVLQKVSGKFLDLSMLTERGVTKLLGTQPIEEVYDDQIFISVVYEIPDDGQRQGTLRIASQVGKIETLLSDLNKEQRGYRKIIWSGNLTSLRKEAIGAWALRQRQLAKKEALSGR